MEKKRSRLYLGDFEEANDTEVYTDNVYTGFKYQGKRTLSLPYRDYKAIQSFWLLM